MGNNTISTRCRVQVEFSELLSNEQLIEEIHLLAAPQIIIWYIGCYGVRKAGVQFYKDFLISPVITQNPQATFWLVDLTAWRAFQNPRSSVQKVNGWCELIETASDNRIKCLKSASIFKTMQEISDQNTVDYFKVALQRKFISFRSVEFPNKNRLTREIFSNPCPTMMNWYDYDVAKSYSIFQYFEGCLLVDEVFSQLVVKESEFDVNIVFALPNDECLYYHDELNSFEDDVSFLINKRCELLNINNVNLRIKFLSFKYGSQTQHRPYNAPGGTLKTIDFSCDVILGNDSKPTRTERESEYAENP